jgi:hypothetical protein
MADAQSRHGLGLCQERGAVAELVFLSRAAFWRTAKLDARFLEAEAAAHRTICARDGDAGPAAFEVAVQTMQLRAGGAAVHGITAVLLAVPDSDEEPPKATSAGLDDIPGIKGIQECHGSHWPTAVV